MAKGSNDKGATKPIVPAPASSANAQPLATPSDVPHFPSSEVKVGTAFPPGLQAARSVSPNNLFSEVITDAPEPEPEPMADDILRTFRDRVHATMRQHNKNDMRITNAAVASILVELRKARTAMKHEDWLEARQDCADLMDKLIEAMVRGEVEAQCTALKLHLSYVDMKYNLHTAVFIPEAPHVATEG